MDTEGLHSSERTTDVDLKIFALTVLLSSSFIFNQMGPINESSLTDLHLIANLVKFFGQKKDTYSFHSYPDFYWCLRDFYHDISEDFDSPKAYMEDCLKPVLGVSQDVLKKNQIRKSICSYFENRECFTFIRPVANESALANIEMLEWEQLNDEFREAVSNFMNILKVKSKPKTLDLKGK
jgi:hypothetical protein